MSGNVYFLEPADGAGLQNPIHLKFAVDGDLEVRPAGDNTPNTGHFCLIIDGRPIPRGNVVPVSERSIHFTKGQSEGDIRLNPGMHTLTLQFTDGAHRSYGPELSQTITVNV
ncbi:DUF4399 domain-containing protein [Nonomuraea bangladeshensis]|uniref:DUF4399 domain-containing protein n=1 Tax=Nonomuraea bangladeshensis TaxID=404385 RepID=UPI003C2EA7F9